MTLPRGEAKKPDGINPGRTPFLLTLFSLFSFSTLASTFGGILLVLLLLPFAFAALAILGDPLGEEEAGDDTTAPLPCLFEVGVDGPARLDAAGEDEVGVLAPPPLEASAGDRAESDRS